MLMPVDTSDTHYAMLFDYWDDILKQNYVFAAHGYCL